MKKYLVLSALVGLMGVATAMAIPTSGTITAWQGAASYSDGGEFTAQVTGDPNTFQTFCIEIFNTFSPGTGYSYVLQQDTHGTPSDAQPPASPLKLGTAWLFNQFVTGGLADDGYNHTPEAAGELQAALWYFQSQGRNPNGAFDKWGNGTPGPGYGFDSYTALAIQALGGVDNAFAPSAGEYGVAVIHLDGGQDWLANVPGGNVPDGGLTITLLGMALAGLGIARQKICK